MTTDTDPKNAAGYVFISYAREDSAHVDRLQQLLENAGIPVWTDRANLWPGQDWRAKIRDSITGDALVFIACFSRVGMGRARSYQNEELTLAIEQMRQRPTDDTWLIPVRFDDCQIPDLNIGGGRTLASLQRADLFGDRYPDNAERLVQAVQRILGHEAATSAGLASSPRSRAAADGRGKASSERSPSRPTETKLNQSWIPGHRKLIGAGAGVGAALIALLIALLVNLPTKNGTPATHRPTGQSISSPVNSTPSRTSPVPAGSGTPAGPVTIKQPADGDSVHLRTMIWVNARDVHPDQQVWVCGPVQRRPVAVSSRTLHPDQQ